MPKRAYALALVLAVFTLVTTTTSRAQARPEHLVDPYFAAKLTLGLGGSTKASRKQNGNTVSQEQNLEVSFGAAGQYLYPLHDYFALGGMLGFQSWRSTADGGGGRNLVFDLAVLPQGKYVILPNQLEVNVGLPLGVALDFWNEVDVNNTWIRFASGGSAGGSVEGDTALGFVIGFTVGARYQLMDAFGLLLELGYLYRTFGHSVTTSTNAASGAGALFQTMSSTDLTISTGQFALNLGAYF